MPGLKETFAGDLPYFHQVFKHFSGYSQNDGLDLGSYRSRILVGCQVAYSALFPREKTQRGHDCEQAIGQRANNAIIID